MRRATWICGTVVTALFVIFATTGSRSEGQEVPMSPEEAQVPALSGKSDRDEAAATIMFKHKNILNAREYLEAQRDLLELMDAEQVETALDATRTEIRELKAWRELKQIDEQRAKLLKDHPDTIAARWIEQNWKTEVPDASPVHFGTRKIQNAAGVRPVPLNQGQIPFYPDPNSSPRSLN